MKTIAIYCANLEMGGITFENDKYWDAYSELLLRLQGRGIEAYFVTDNASYLGSGRFKQAYTLFKPGHPKDLITIPDVQADLVFDRGGFRATDMPVMNPPEVFRLGSDKIAMYEAFGRYQPFSIVCHNAAELEAAFKKLPAGCVVVKEPVSSGGSGVYIGTRAQVQTKLRGVAYPVLAQAFIDTSIGIPGITKGIHDLRLGMLSGGQILSVDYRTPAAGEYRANVALGGVSTYLERDQIPGRLVRIARQIDAGFGDKPRFYCIDFANTPEGWKMIELNTWPGLIPSGFGPQSAYVMKKLVEELVRAVRATRPASKQMQLVQVR